MVPGMFNEVRLLLGSIKRTKCVWPIAEVFNVCHTVDPTEIPSSVGGPHGPRRAGFNLSYVL